MFGCCKTLLCFFVYLATLCGCVMNVGECKLNVARGKQWESAGAQGLGLFATGVCYIHGGVRGLGVTLFFYNILYMIISYITYFSSFFSLQPPSGVKKLHTPNTSISKTCAPQRFTPVLFECSIGLHTLTFTYIHLTFTHCTNIHVTTKQTNAHIVKA